MAREIPRAELLPGTVDMLILNVLAAGANHGYGIARRIKQTSDEFLTLEEGSLYPALHRLEKRGLLEFEWRASESNRRAKYYRLTAAGRRRLSDEVSAWRRLSQAIERVLTSAPGGQGARA